jgi:large conductance mechanosensitive channel
LAVAVVIGAAFGKIVTSFVEDVLMPPIGLALGQGRFFPTCFSIYLEKTFPVWLRQRRRGAATLNYGMFFNHIINFVIVAFAIFMLVKQINRMQAPPAAPAAAPPTKDCPHCLAAISDQGDQVRGTCTRT